MNVRCFTSLLALSTALPAGCNCPDADVAPLQFTLQFSTDTLGAGHGFRTAEIRDSYLVRYKDNQFRELADTLRAVVRTSYSYFDDSLRIYYPAPGLPPQFSLPSSYHDFYAASGYGSAKSFVLRVGPSVFRLNDFKIDERTTGLLCPQTHQDHYFAALNGQRIDARGGYLLTR